ncbi:MAG: ABC transporter ATP-binding protein [Kiritimatiellae bacterium]|nr:ABC transporter ATP-binding protein [Kiritimatiellia bacterium]
MKGIENADMQSEISLPRFSSPCSADNVRRESGRDDCAVEAKNMTKTFGRFTAVDRLTFSIRRGEVFGFLGPNGAGKSTAIRMLCGLLRPTSGTAFVNGIDIRRDPESVRAQIGYMSQKFSLYKDISVIENINFFGGVYGLCGEKLRDRAARIIEASGLGGLEKNLTGTLSGALQQRLALACAILHEPPVLFLDEPTSGIDPISRRIFWDMIRAMAARRIAVLVTTHFLDEAELCDRLGFITAGKLIALGKPGELKKMAVDEDLFELTLAAFSSAGRMEQTSLFEAREKIRQIEGVQGVSYFGRNLHIFCRRGVLPEDKLGRELRRQGLAPLALRAVAPRLEDAFIRLAGQTAGKADE